MAINLRKKPIILLENNIRHKSRGLWVVNQLRIRLLSAVNQQNVTGWMAKMWTFIEWQIFQVNKSVHPSADGTSKTSTHPLPFLLSFAFRFIAFQLRPFITSTSTARGFPYHFVVLGLKYLSCSSCEDIVQFIQNRWQRWCNRRVFCGAVKECRAPVASRLFR
jgi:hypothetical protein